MAEKEKSKKRKRNTESHDTPHKKATAAVPAPQVVFSSVKVKHIKPEEDALGPIVASTPGIAAPQDIAFTPYRRTYTTAREGDKKRRQILLQSSQHGRLDYIAQEEQAGGPLGNLKHYVGIYDPLAGEFTLTECPQVTLRSSLRPTQEELDEEVRQRDRQTFTSMRMSLGQEFGTKKAKKVIADATVNAINQRKPGETAPPVDASQQAILDSLNIKTEGMMTSEELQREVDKSKPRPDPNMNATSPAGVYPLENLASEDDLGLIQVREWQQAVKKGENVQLTVRYVARRLQKVATSKDAKNLKLLKYVHIMLTWFVALDSNRGGGKKLPHRDKLKEKLDAPAAILDSLRKKFTDGQFMTKWHVDKFILYVCALALHIDNFEVDINDVQEDLRLNPNEMQRYFSELGCRITALTAAQRDALRIGTKEAASHKMARLQLPLEFPKQRSGRAGQRR